MDQKGKKRKGTVGRTESSVPLAMEPGADTYGLHLVHPEDDQRGLTLNFTMAPANDPQGCLTYKARFHQMNDDLRWQGIQTCVEELVLGVQANLPTDEPFDHPDRFFHLCVDKLRTQAHGLRLCHGHWRHCQVGWLIPTPPV